MSEAVGLRRFAPGRISPVSWAVAASFAAHAAGVLLIPAWQKFDASLAPAPAMPLQARLLLREPPTPVVVPTNARSAERALAVPAAPAAAVPAQVAPAPAVVQAREMRNPEILTVHRDVPPDRPISAPGESASAPVQAPEHVHAVASGSNSATGDAGPVRERLAMATTRAVLTHHSDVAYLHNPKPAYPPMARKLGLEGTVRLRILVDPDGATDQARILDSSGTEVLDNAALEAVRRWRFVPAREGKVAVAHWVDIPITFKLGVP